MSMPSQPPDGEFAQTIQRMPRRERYAVIRADRLRQAEFLERALEHGEGELLLGGRQRFAGQQVATGEIGDRQRIAVPMIAKHELAFVIGAPQRVGLGRARQLGPRWPRGDADADDAPARGGPAPHGRC